MKWIKINDDLPKSKSGGFVDCIYYEKYHGQILIGMFNTLTKQFQKHNYDVVVGVTHWMPLPEKPKN